MTTLRRIALLLATALGLVAASTAPAAAGLNLGNHCEPTTPREGPIMTTLRRIALLLATALGLIAASTAPAAAGLLLQNHCEPPTPLES